MITLYRAVGYVRGELAYSCSLLNPDRDTAQAMANRYAASHNAAYGRNHNERMTPGVVAVQHE